MKKILMLSTGGTIASVESGQGLAPQISGQQMIDMIPELAEVCEIDCREIMNLDSTNIQPEEWQIMAKAVYGSLPDYDGFVIAHGTDTMAYSASALTFMLRDVNKPVVLTGSQLPIENPHTDGKRNLLDAFRTAAAGVPGVFIVFCGRIIKGVRARKMYTKRLDAFHSINAPDAGKVRDGKVIWTTRNETDEHTMGEPGLQTKVDTRVLVYKITPGFQETLLEQAVELGYRGIVLEAFGCGGVPYLRRNLLPVIQKAIDMGVVVVVATQCEYDGCDLEVYEVGRKAAEAGCLSGLDMTVEALVAKLMWALGGTDEPEKIREIMMTCYAGEFNKTSIL